MASCESCDLFDPAGGLAARDTGCLFWICDAGRLCPERGLYPGAVGDEWTNSLLFGLLLCDTQFLVAPVGWLAGGWTASFGLPASFRPLVYMACIAVVSGVEMALLYLLRLPWKRQLLRILPLAALNSCVLGTLLLGRTQNFTLTQALGFGLGSGVGYLMAVLLVTEAQNRLRSQAIPSAFRGMPITLIYIGVLALAIYGFTGHTVIL